MLSPFTAQPANDFSALKHAIMNDIQAIDDVDNFLAVDVSEDYIFTLLCSGQDTQFNSTILS